MRHFILFLLAVAASHSASALEPVDRAMIEEMIKESAIHWNQHAGRGFGKHFSKDAEFINILGQVITGREAIEGHHIKALASHLKGSKLQFYAIKIRELAPTVAVALAFWKLTGPPKSATAKKPQQGVNSNIFVKLNDKWEVANCHGTATFAAK